MKMRVKAICKSKSLFPASTYLDRYVEYGLKREMLEYKYSPNKGVYQFRLEGKEKDIKHFLSFLKMEGSIKIV